MMTEQREQNNTAEGFKVSRRELLTAGGATLVGAALVGFPASSAASGKTFTGSKESWMKEVVLPRPGSTDPVELSIAESRFWNEQMMEHAQFFIMLMPGAELADERNQAERFQRTFADQLAKAKTARLDRGNYAAFNRSNIEALKPYADWKRRMGEAQASGKLRSLVWQTFFDHTATEAEHLVTRLEQFSRGDVTSEMTETAKFWTQIMGEHADFIAHLLDPAERDLIMKAMQTADGFHKAHDNLPASKDPVERMVDEIIDFKVAGEKGIIAGKIKSIIHPSLADHVRREALKAADDLKRAA
jgi:hypothetical protein